MRKVTSGLFVSMDGVVEAPNLWQFDVFDQDMIQAMSEEISAIDTVLLGRVTYQEWLPYWPNATEDLGYADFINKTPKFVFSRTLKEVDWGNAVLVNIPMEEKVRQLKAAPGQNIGVQGSPGLVRSLIENNLLDELTLLIHPVVVGQGKKFYTDGTALKRFKLLECKTSGSGVVMATYRLS